MMAAKSENYPLIKYYFKNVEDPIEVNTVTKQPLKEIVEDETYRFIVTLKKHIKKTLPIVPEKHCAVCLVDWEEDDTEDSSEQGIPFWCADKGHVYHLACAAKWNGNCPICGAAKKGRDEAVEFSVSKKDIMHTQET